MADPAPVAAATALVERTRDGGGDVRVLGGVGVALRCPSARPGGPLAREYSDIDVAVSPEGRQVLEQAAQTLGYVPAQRFNAVHGHSRMMFDHPERAHVDVFVGRFAMCHRLELTARLAVHDTTLPLADLLLTKLQVAALTEKDVIDVAALLLDHRLTRDEEGINLAYVTRVLSRDWGWWRTVSENLQALPGHLDARLPAASTAVVSSRASELLDAIEAEPKSLRWKARAKAGDRLPWREMPEETR